MATARFRWSPDRRSLAVLAHSGELLAVVDVRDGWSEHEAALRALDAALMSGRVLRQGALCQVAWYNPATFEVAVGALPETKAFSDGDMLSLDAHGLLAVLDDDKLTCEGGRVLSECLYDSYAKLTRAYTAHSAPI